MTYEEFLQQKRHSSLNYGIELKWLPDAMFDYQKHVTEYAIKKGRCAVFLDTGLGKTLIELAVAKNYAESTNKKVLIITPLAVAYQFEKEAARFGVDSVYHSKDGSMKGDIIVANYERLHYFTPDSFDCVILDESSILKNFEGATKQAITAFMKKVKYRFLFTATPSPNDYIELGTSSEALGYMGYADMLTKFFKTNKGSIDVKNAGCEWYLKPHAEKDFWSWVRGWSISMRKPSDLGFDDTLHILPPLHEIETVVNNSNILAVNGQYRMFNMPAVNFFEIKAEVRSTVKDRCVMAVEKAMQHDCSVYWVNLNDEASEILALDKDAKEVKGKMNVDQKEELLIAFSDGQLKRLVTKTSITAFGLNWQHCNHTTYFPTFSYEQYYQAIRRFWRFGQQRPVYVDIILSDGQERIMNSLIAKKDKAIQMFEELVKSTNELSIKKANFDKKITLPNFLKTNQS